MMDESIGEVFVTIKADVKELEDEVRKLKAKLDKDLPKPRIDYDTVLGKKHLAELKILQDQLEAKLKQKISLNADLNSINRTRAVLNSVNSQLSGLQNNAEKTGLSFGGMLKQGLSVAAGFLGLQAALNFGKTILTTASDFEQLRTRLVSLYGSTEKAGQVFEQFKQIAATTPFSLKQTVEAGATLKAFGMNAEATLKSVTDLAAFMGMDLVEASNAVGRAFAGGAGAADILRERGVLNLIKDFKKVDDITNLSLPKFREALLQAMVDPALGIAGSTDRLSKTFQGSFSNMMDSVDKFAAFLGSKILPVLNPIIKAVTGLLDAITKEDTEVEKANKKHQEQVIIFDRLKSRYEELRSKTQLTKNEQALYNSTVAELQKRYPDILGKMNLQKGLLSDIETGFKKVREQMIAQMRLEIEMAKAKDLLIEQSNINENITKSRTKKEEAQTEIGQIESGKKPNPVVRTDVRTDTQVRRLDELEAFIRQYDKDIIDYENQYRELQGRVDKILKDTGKTQADLNPQAGSATTTRLDLSDKERKDRLAKFRDEVEMLEKLDQASDLYRTKAITLIKAESSELIKSGRDKKIVLQDEARLINEVEVAYSRARAEKERYTERANPNPDELSNVRLVPKKDIPKQLGEVTETQKPDLEDSKLQRYYDWMKDGNPFAGENPFVSAVEASMDAANGFADAFFDDLVLKANGAESDLEKAFMNMANAFIVQVERMAAQWLAFQTVQALLSFIPGVGTATSIGSVVSSNITRAAAGANFVVPPGFENDNYPMLVKSGEHVNVTPVGKVGEQERLLNTLIGRMDVLNYNLIENSMKRPENSNVNVTGKIGNDAIYISNQTETKYRRNFS